MGFWDVFAQPLATLGAAGMAVVAAGIAWKGVKLSVNAQRDEAKKDRDLQWRKIQRSERLGLLSDAARVAAALSSHATVYAAFDEALMPAGHEEPKAGMAKEQEAFDATYAETRSVLLRLRVLGLTEVEKALEALLSDAGWIVHPPPPEFAHEFSEEWTVYDHREKVDQAIRGALDEVPQT
ncbi:hypothetical protein [Williamsia herbipolensis]|uniref:hypothetical protein n=1 Tax=Williamsia herbipolensis TaxID=1603258 RepID=UPI0005F85C45|nr:hypothetical protein [Williamsia herbipolensis]